jgi:hypothetical protein
VQIQKRYWFGLLAVALGGLTVFLSLPPAEAIVNGHPVSYWACQFDGDGLTETPEAIQNALAAMDNRCIHTLIKELDWKPSPLVEKVNEWNIRWFHHRSFLPKDWSAAAALTLGHLGSRATNAIPALEKASRIRMRFPEEGEDVRGAAIAALVLLQHDSLDMCARKSLDVADPYSGDYQRAIYLLKTNAIPCLPIFIDALRSTTNYSAKYYAAHALVRVHRPDLSLSPLASMLKETNAKSRSIAAKAFGSMGHAAGPVWDDLVVLLNDPDEEVRWNVTNALRAIDSPAAEQLGVRPSEFE